MLQIQHFALYSLAGRENFANYISANNRAAIFPAILSALAAQKHASQSPPLFEIANLCRFDLSEVSLLEATQRMRLLGAAKSVGPRGNALARHLWV